MIISLGDSVPEMQMVMHKDSKRMKTKFFIVDILGFAEYNFNTTE